MTNAYDGYAWSSYAAFKEGNPDATAGMRRIYPDSSDVEIVTQHEMRMDRILEAWKRKRANEIARKRQNGYAIPADPLTDECRIAQIMTHAQEVQRELERLHAERDLVQGAKAKRELIIRQIRAALDIHPDFNAGEISQLLAVPMRTVYRYMKSMPSNPA